MAPLLLIGAALGGAAMYLLDPDRGRRRRALLLNQAIRTGRKVRDAVDAGTRDLMNRGAAVPHRVRSLFRSAAISDDLLVERVRSKMGRYVSHPHAIEATAADGQVTLSGSILAHEYSEFIEAIRGMGGVKAVMDRLVVHKTADGVPELQGGRRRRGERTALLQDNWSPGIRIVTGSTGAILALYGLRSRGIAVITALSAGAALLVRTATNQPLRQLSGMRGRGIDIRKTIQMNAPVEEVFEFFAHYENFPRFMRNVREVEERGNGRSHWTVAGPAGTTVEWDSITTQLEPNRHIAWRTVEGSPVQHAGMIKLKPVDGGTRVHIQMAYNPPASLLGHAIAKVFGADPKSELEEDLMRLKSTLETGKPPHDAAQRNAGIGARA